MRLQKLFHFIMKYVFQRKTHRELVCFEYVSRSVQSVLMMDLSMKSANGTGNTTISVPNVIFLQATEFSKAKEL